MNAEPQSLSDMLEHLRRFQKEHPAPPESVSVSPEAYEAIKRLFQEFTTQPFETVTHFAGIRIKIMTGSGDA
jgi:hypothetical protein